MLNKFLNAAVLLLFICFLPLSAQTKPDALKLYKEGKYAQAAAVCIEEISTDPNNLDSYTVLCWSLVSNRQYTEAEYWGNAARKINPYDHRIIEILGEAKYYLGDNISALQLFQEYISLVSISGARIGTAYYFMGEIFIRQGKYNHADISLTQAVQFDPLQETWWTRLGYAREKSYLWKNSLSAYERALVLNPLLQDALQGRTRVSQKIR